MKETSELLKNLVYGAGYLKTTIKEGVITLKPYAKDLEAIHIRIDYPDPSTWRKKKYYHISREEVYSRLDEYIFKHLIDQNEYAAYLKRYRPAKAQGKIGDIDEHIMDIHYRPRAIKMLRRKKFFNLARWTKKRICLEYHRRSNLYWKSGEEFRFDYRNPVESLFIRKNHANREVIGIGGAGGSSQRETNTFFTAVFYVLGKKTRIPHYLLQYSGLNEFEYIGRRYRPVLTAGFGNNFSLDERLAKEIWKKGFANFLTIKHL
ncbi:MAG: hypothetical protein L6309_05810 [Candidatus Omnitrophica bacterium]|nr:hypothetical protein [Candidatus Omnitrophota bacterium]